MGGRFCSLDLVHSQVRKYFSGNYVTSSPKLSEDQKKKKKKIFTAIWDYIRPEFVGFNRADRPFFVWFSISQISMGGR